MLSRSGEVIKLCKESRRMLQLPLEMNVSHPMVLTEYVEPQVAFREALRMANNGETVRGDLTLMPITGAPVSARYQLSPAASGEGLTCFLTPIDALEARIQRLQAASEEMSEWLIWIHLLEGKIAASLTWN